VQVTVLGFELSDLYVIELLPLDDFAYAVRPAMRTRAQDGDQRLSHTYSVHGVRVPHENRLHLILGQRAHGVKVYDKTVLFATEGQERVMI